MADATRPGGEAQGKKMLYSAPERGETAGAVKEGSSIFGKQACDVLPAPLHPLGLFRIPMSKLRRIYPWISLLVSLGLGLWVYSFVTNLSHVEPVVVAARALPPLSVLGPGDVRIAYFQPDAIVPGAARSRQEVLGMTCLRQVFPGEQIILAGLSGHSGALSSVVAAGMRAIAVPVTPGRCAGGAVRRGDVVDLVFVSDRVKTGSCVSKVIANRVPVIDVRDERGSQYSGERDNLPSSVVVLVPDRLATLVPWCLENGWVYVVAAPLQPGDATAAVDTTGEEVLH